MGERFAPSGHRAENDPHDGLDRVAFLASIGERPCGHPLGDPVRPCPRCEQEDRWAALERTTFQTEEPPNYGRQVPRRPGAE